MAMPVAELKEWLLEMPDDAWIGLAEDFMGLEVDHGPGTEVVSWIECGMLLSSEEVND